MATFFLHDPCKFVLFPLMKKKTKFEIVSFINSSAFAFVHLMKKLTLLTMLRLAEPTKTSVEKKELEGYEMGSET
jgi:hypothetical protein